MRTLWNAVSFVAVVNLLALLMLGVWLWFSGRLNEDRVMRLRELFATTIAEEQAAAEAADAAAQLAEAAAAEEAWAENPPLPSGAAIQRTNLTDGQSEQALRRVQDEAEDLLAQIQQRESQLAEREEAFEARCEAWRSATEAERSRRVDEQFQKTVAQYAAASPKLARQWLINLIDDGQKDQAVAYLDAMDTRAAKKILNEFKTEEDAALATELLERLRTFGLEAESGEDPGNDEPLADTD
jgi:hypothetical protein